MAAAADDDDDLPLWKPRCFVVARAFLILDVALVQNSAKTMMHHC